MASMKTRHIVPPKFYSDTDCNPYPKWRLKMEKLFRDLGLWNVVRGSETNPTGPFAAVLAWEEKNTCAIELLYKTMEPEKLRSFLLDTNINNAADLWRAWPDSGNYQETGSENDPEVLVVSDMECQILKSVMESRARLLSSQSYQKFIKDMEVHMKSFLQTSQLGNSDFPAIDIVMYGIGSLRSNFSARNQLGLILQLREDMEVFKDAPMLFYEPVMSKVERVVLERLGITIIPIDEEAKRYVTRPTLFYMPRNPFYLCENLVKANWESLHNVAIVGNSILKIYERNSNIPLAREDLVTWIPECIDRGMTEYSLEKGDLLPCLHHMYLHLFPKKQE